MKNEELPCDMTAQPNSSFFIKMRLFPAFQVAFTHQRFQEIVVGIV